MPFVIVSTVHSSVYDLSTVDSERLGCWLNAAAIVVVAAAVNVVVVVDEDSVYG